MPFAIAASRRISLFGSKISGFGLSPSRVGADGCPPAPPLEPYLKVSPHTARALIRPTIHYSLTRRPFPNSLTIVCRQPQPVLLQSSASGRISQLALAIICCPIYERFHLLSRHFRPDRRGHIQRITTDISFFGHPNAAPPDPPYGKVCPSRWTRSTAFPRSTTITG